MMRVKKEDLRLGMFIQSLEGSWFDHPFWKTKFLLTEEADLRALQDSDIEAVQIDDAKSLAPALAHLPGSHAGPKLAPAVRIAIDRSAKPSRANEPQPRPVTHPSEYVAARKVLDDYRAVVGELFARVESGSAEAIYDAGPVVSDIAESVERNPDALITLTRVRTIDEYTYMHSVAVSALMINLARQLKLPPDFVTQAGTAGLFMDVGKGFLPPILLSKRDAYTAENWAEMRRHPQLGADAVRSSGDLSRIVSDVCLRHHERYDGSGYPDGLKGDEISLFARMAAICDTYDALVSPRPHRAAFGPADAIVEMYKIKRRFDESLLASFIKSIGVYPVGTLVRLESQMLACVTFVRRDQLSRPVVRTFYSIPKRAHVPVRQVDLGESPEPDRIVSREEPSRWGFADWEGYAMALIQGQKARHAA